MTQIRTNSLAWVAAILAIAIAWGRPTLAQDTSFTYQGELKDNGGLATGSFDMNFLLWNAITDGVQIGAPNHKPAVVVTDGRFSVQLDMGANAFDNSSRWLEITVGGFTLSPRQPITRSPYSIQTRGIFVDDDQKVGLGTNSPQHLLHVVGDAGPGKHAIYGRTTQTASGSAGVYGQSDSPTGEGVSGRATANSGINYGLFGRSDSMNGMGAYARAASNVGPTKGMYARADSDSGIGMYAYVSHTSGNTNALWAQCVSPNGFAGRFIGRSHFSGNTGFGASNPLYPVHVYPPHGGTAVYAHSWSNGPAIHGYCEGTNGYAGYFEGRGYFSGNVGIGTTTPTAKMHIRGESADVGLRVYRQSSATMYQQLDIRGSSINTSGNDQVFGNPMKLNDSSGNGISLVEGGGNVGIGGASAGFPLVRLHVDGGTNASVSDVASGFVTIGNPASNNIVMDNNEIMARDGGSTSPLHLNAEGGDVIVGGTLDIGYEIVESFVEDMNDATATCPTGKRIIGGGCSASGAAIRQSSSGGGSQSWFCITDVEANSIWATAICARVK